MKALSILINIFFPGFGTLIIGKWVQGILQILLFFLGLLLAWTFIGIIVGAPLMFVAWLWAIITTATAEDQRAVKTF